MSAPEFPCLLTINLPTALVDDFLDSLRQIPQWVSGCTVTRAEGFGAAEHYASVMERVRGRANRSLAQMVIGSPDQKQVLDYLAQHFGEAGLWHWVTPVLACGALHAPEPSAGTS